MTLDQFNAFCGSLKATTHNIQWGGADVWKVGPSWEKGKVFVIAGFGAGLDERVLRMSFKVSDIAWEILQDAPGCIPAPYLASRGMKWIQAVASGGAKGRLSDKELRGYIEHAHALVAQGLPKKARAELGLD